MSHHIARVLESLFQRCRPVKGEEARRQRARRRALWLAGYGIDVGPRLIHGVEVTA